MPPILTVLLRNHRLPGALELAKAGQYKIIYVAPERLETSRFLDFACHTELSMITVDEAHCISQWGQDFRPSYVRIPDFIRQLPMRPVLSAFTATAYGAGKRGYPAVSADGEPF